jgi:hypothetical protein
MGRHPTGNRQYNIKHIWDTHHEIMRLLAMGLKRPDIARMLGVSTVTVTNVQNSPICADHLQGLRDKRDDSAVEMTAAIKELAPLAVAKLEEVMQCGLPNIELSAAKDILDRAGYTPITRVRTENYNLHFTAEEIAGIKQRAKETGLISTEDRQEAIECTQ